MGRGSGGHDAPFYDVVTACKEVDTDVLVVQEAWVPDGEDGDVLAVAAALGYRVAATFVVARAECHDRVRLVARSGDAGDGDWQLAVRSRLPVIESRVHALEPQLPRTPAAGRCSPSPSRWAARRSPCAAPTCRCPRTRCGASPGRCAGRCRPRTAGRPCRRHEHVGLVHRRSGRPRLATGRSGADVPGTSTPCQIDHILVSRPVEVVDAQVVRQGMSDHRPIRARLRF
jgi:endonuclease/exonuclease/phosphatase family metal-dependent hydrolase